LHLVKDQWQILLQMCNNSALQLIAVYPILHYSVHVYFKAKD